MELAERLTGLEEVTLIDDDGSPSAGRQIAIWNPPVIDQALGVLWRERKQHRVVSEVAGEMPSYVIAELMGMPLELAGHQAFPAAAAAP